MAKQKQTFTAPWYPWYVKDVLTSERVEMMSLAEEGAYRRAIDKAWQEGSVPAEAAVLAKVIGKGCSVKIAEVVLSMFQPMPKRPDRMISKKLEKVRAEQELKYLKNKVKGEKGALTRWAEKGGQNTDKKSTKNGHASSDNIPSSYQETSKNAVNRSKQTSSAYSPTNSPTIAEPMPKQWHSESESDSSYEEKEKELRVASAIADRTHEPVEDVAPPLADARKSHPAIVAVQATVGIYPPKEIWDTLIDHLGVDVDVGKLRKCYTTWRAKGWNKTNYDWALDWYVNGIREGKQNGANNGNRTAGKSTSVDRLKEQRTFIDQYPTEAELGRHS